MRKKAINIARIHMLAFASVMSVSLMIGCAGDGGANPMSELFSPQTDSLAEARRDIQQFQPLAKPGPLGASQTEFVWYTDYEKARLEAAQTGKLILADFTGSDWCHWCVKLKKDRFEKPEFQAWARENVVLLELDYPKNSSLPLATKMQNEKLKKKYDIRSYPTVLLLNPNGSVQAKMGYESGKSASEWVQLAESRLNQSVSDTRYVAERTSGGGTLR